MGYNQLFDRDHEHPFAFETLELDERICKTCGTDFLTEKSRQEISKAHWVRHVQNSSTSVLFCPRLKRMLLQPQQSF